MTPYAKAATLVLRLAAFLIALGALVVGVPAAVLTGGPQGLAAQLLFTLAVPAALAAASRPLGALLARGLE